MITSDKIRVLIVDDHQVVREGLRSFLDVLEDIELVGEAADGISAVEMVKQFSPDVVLMDLVLPKLDGIEATRQVKTTNPNTKVIVLTSFTEDEKVFPAIQAGASSYLLKDVSPESLIDAIRAAHHGEARLHPDITRKLMEQIIHPPNPIHPAHLDDLSEREKGVVRLVARGLSNHEIAQELVISERTVKTHISNILSKLHLNDRTQLAIYAIKNGLADAG
jgi:NarL family two-component system response regulator LiaR